MTTDYDEDVYDGTESDEEDELLDGDEDLGVVDPVLDTIYNLEVVSCRSKMLPPREGSEDTEDQRVINVQLMISEGEFEGERSFHTFWMGPRGRAVKPQHKRARKSFNKFFEACTGEKIGVGSKVDPRSCDGANISAKYVTAAYKDKEGVMQREGEAKWDDFSWKAPISVDYDNYDEDEDDPV